MAILTGWLLSQKSNLSNQGTELDVVPSIGSDFAGTGAPKTKFLFTVEFGINTNIIGGIQKGAEQLERITLDLKNASRPDISIVYEDVNYYGVRTKVATKTNFGQLRLTFYEDAFNNANGIFWKYMNLVSPLTNLRDGGRLITGQTGGDDNAATGGLSSQLTTIGPLPNGWQDGVIEYIKLHHHYIGGGHQRGGITTYTYYNPKLENLQYDELDMSSSDVATITATFTVDAITFGDKQSPPFEVG